MPSLTTRFAVAAVVAGPAAAQTPAPGRPEGEMRWALYLTLAPAWFDPGEVTAGFLTPSGSCTRCTTRS